MTKKWFKKEGQGKLARTHVVLTGDTPPTLEEWREILQEAVANSKLQREVDGARGETEIDSE